MSLINGREDDKIFQRGGWIEFVNKVRKCVEVGNFPKNESTSMSWMQNISGINKSILAFLYNEFTTVNENIFV